MKNYLLVLSTRSKRQTSLDYQATFSRSCFSLHPSSLPPSILLSQACMGAGFVAGPALGLLGSRVFHLNSRGVRREGRREGGGREGVMEI